MEVRRAGGAFNVATFGDDAVELARLHFLFGPPLLDGEDRDERVINHKLAEAVGLGAEGLNIRWEGLRRTPNGHIAADLIISKDDTKIKHNVYLREHDILLEFQSADRSRAELAARLLKLAGVGAEVKKVSSGGVWCIVVTTNRLAAGCGELRRTLAEIVRKAVESSWVDAGKAEHWLEKLERGLTLREGWSKYSVWLKEGALRVRYRSTNPDNIKQVAQRFREMGLEEGVHFSVKMPEGGGCGLPAVGRILSTPPGSPFTAPVNSRGGWRPSS